MRATLTHLTPHVWLPANFEHGECQHGRAGLVAGKEQRFDVICHVLTDCWAPLACFLKTWEAGVFAKEPDCMDSAAVILEQSETDAISQIRIALPTKQS